jgi:prepilin-type N-terminal cleavage/methylation domain-containing protein
LDDRRYFIRRALTDERGFTILESLIALAIAAMAIGMVYQSTTQNLLRSNAIKTEYEMTEFAASLLAEDTVTHNVAGSGSYGDKWSWKLTRTPAKGMPKTPFDNKVFIERITVTVSQNNQTDITLFTEVVRRK